MKPISKTFKFSGGKTLKVSDDGYEFCGDLLSEHDTTVLDGVATTVDNGYLFAVMLKRFIGEWIFWDDCYRIHKFVRRHWTWKKGS